MRRVAVVRFEEDGVGREGDERLEGAQRMVQYAHYLVRLVVRDREEVGRACDELVEKVVECGSAANSADNA